MKIITISREFGSGGREVGKRLADALGFAYFDDEIVQAIAERSELDADYVDSVIEKGVFSEIPITFGHTFAYIPYYQHTGFSIIENQNKILKELAAKGDCVIVGRNADVILKEHNPLKIFVHADMNSKIKRCVERADKDEQLTERQMRKKIRQIDRSRANAHAYYSEIRWGDKNGYDLCLNTTGMVIKTVVPSLAHFAESWFKK